MTAALAPTRIVPSYPRGVVREFILAHFRRRLREKVDPTTGALFAEEVITAATSAGSKYWAEADGIDLLLLAEQSRFVFLVNQVEPRLASTAWLERYHKERTGLPRLESSPGSGPVSATGAPFDTFVGSVTVPDVAAAVARDVATGLRFQVLYTEIADADGNVNLVMAGIDKGPATNVITGKELAWISGAPLGATAPAIVTGDFTGGLRRETDAEWGLRMESEDRAKQGAGNPAELRAWARRASTAIADAYVYSCAVHAGSTVVCVLGKRGDQLGPEGRKASTDALALARQALTPPGSPNLPTPPWVLVVTPGAYGIDFFGVRSDLTMMLELPTLDASGYTDETPWPESGGVGPAVITAMVSQIDWTLTRAAGSAGLPSGISQPSMMAWDAEKSRWEKLIVASVSALGGDDFRVVLSQAPTFTIQTAITAHRVYVSPDTEQRDTIAAAIVAYFDDLGPGEVVDLATDDRAHRAMRQPLVNEEQPSRAGSPVLSYIEEALQAALGDHELEVISAQVPPIPTNPVDGPQLMVCGRVGIYPPSTT